MEPTLLLEVAAIVAVGFEILKRFINHYFKPKNADFVFRALLVVVSLAVAAAYKFYFEGHPEIMKTASQLAVSAAGIWALIIKWVPTKKKNVVLQTRESE